MSDDKKTEAPQVWVVEYEGVPVATHIRAEGLNPEPPYELNRYVPAYQLAGVTAKLEAAEGRVQELEAESSSTREWVPRLTARVRELESELSGAKAMLSGVRNHMVRVDDAWERWQRGDLSTEEFSGTVAELSYQRDKKPAPEAAKPAECLQCSHLLAEHDAGFCKRCECGGYIDPSESASPPSQAAELSGYAPPAVQRAMANGYRKLAAIEAADPERAEGERCGWCHGADKWPGGDPCPDCGRPEVFKPEPPRADGPDVLTVLIEALQHVASRAHLGPTERLLALADELERAQKGTR